MKALVLSPAAELALDHIWDHTAEHGDRIKQIIIRAKSWRPATPLPLVSGLAGLSMCIPDI
jgi:hypothetical protein